MSNSRRDSTRHDGAMVLGKQFRSGSETDSQMGWLQVTEFLSVRLARVEQDSVTVEVLPFYIRLCMRQTRCCKPFGLHLAVCDKLGTALRSLSDT